ncbi:putative ABC transport system permease protein [Rhizomicrobium palustre]|uniref:Putative ABC transport system permease protein n=1 Tax=Rhizomicrobium palustre TaxID=189966 RepID=A0A846MTB1_9PROT|nr:FtsX-like permease family protein [Rhizomicrobium palustre]NIK86738.1 putative ABC transport system permease protein [Rhizomicrobium palustre]
MMLFKIALRNILRNGRRSLMTASAIAVGAVALTLFGEYNDFVFLGLETQTVMQTGHLAVYKQGYFDFGSGNPAGYSISRYEKVMETIKTDPVLKPMLRVVTPTVNLFGIAGNFSINASKTFFGTGFVPADRERMRHWDPYHLITADYHFPPLGISDADINRGVIGVGMARVLGLCGPLKVKNCPAQPVEKPKEAASVPASSVDFAELAARDVPAAEKSGTTDMPRLDLLSATASGAPNVVSFYVTGAQNQGVKELDDMFVGMNLKLAQELLYGRGEHKAVSLILQLNRTQDMSAVKARLAQIFAEQKLDLEVHDFTETAAGYTQIKSFLTVLFVFLAVIMGVIVIFTVINTMSMSVMERTQEIGTARAMGVRRSGIRVQFLIEGLLLGAFGATAGLILGSALAVWFNHANIMYTPPGRAQAVAIRLLVNDFPLLVRIWISLVIIATIGSLVPANRASRMKVVDALRHV